MQQSIKKLARIHDEYTGLTEVEFGFARADGKALKRRVRAANADNVRELRRELVNGGADIPEVEAEKILRPVVNSAPRAERVYATQPGWRDNERSFVFRNRAKGRGADTLAGVSRIALPSECPMPLRKGTIRAWRKRIAKPAADSSVAMFAISVAFAAPLLRLLRYPSFGFCLYGTSKCGKSAVTIAAGSVIGLASILKWNTKRAALEQNLSMFNDFPFLIDDLNSRRGKKEVTAEEVADYAHLVAGGEGTVRHGIFGQSTGVQHNRWRTILLTSREESIASLFKQSGKQRELGEAVRLIDVPSLLPGEENIFDRTSKTFNAETVQRITSALYSKAEVDRGKVFDKFVAELVRDQKQCVEFINDSIHEFTRKFEITSGPVYDVLNKFALVYAGGALATKLGLTGWQQSDLLDSVGKLFDAARKHLPDPEKSRRQGAIKLEKLLASLPPRRDILQAQPGTGYFLLKKNSIKYVVRNEMFGRCFKIEADIKHVKQKLLDLKLLGTTKSRQTGATKPKEQPKWPNGDRIRSVIIVLPKGESLRALLGYRK